MMVMNTVLQTVVKEIESIIIPEE